MADATASGAGDEAAVQSPHLAPLGAPLVPRFPLEDRQTGLVLQGSGPGELRVHWCLRTNDLQRAAGHFPRDGARPGPLIRLVRERPDGGADRIVEVPLISEAREGQGETGFRVGSEPGRFRAELGLATGDGGWLMLARSNGLDHVTGTGVDLSRLAPSLGAGESAPEPPILPLTEPPSGRRPEPPGGMPEPALMSGDLLATGGSFPLVFRPGAVRDAAHGIGATAGASAGPGEGQTQTDGGRLGPARDHWSGPVPLSALAPGLPELDRAGGRGLPDLGVVDLIPPVPFSDDWTGEATAPPSTQEPLPGLPVRLDAAIAGAETGAQASAEAVTAEAQPLAILAYQQPPLRALGVKIEAELRILGWAAPNSQVDLFGIPFCVGPGGRFQLVLRVSDPALLRRALELDPPQELQRRRDD